MKDFDLKDSKQWSRMGPRAMFGQFMLRNSCEKNERSYGACLQILEDHQD